MKEMKEYLKKYKKVHGKSISKMCKEEMMKLLKVVKQHEMMTSMPEKEFEKHVEDMKKMRSLMSSKPEKAEAKKPEAKKMVRAKVVPKAHVVKIAKEEPKTVRVASEPHIAPIMKSSIIQKGEDEDIRYALGKPVKIEKFEVEKELTKALSPEKKEAPEKKKKVRGETLVIHDSATEHEDVEPKRAKRVLTAEHLAKMREGRERTRLENAKEKALEKARKEEEKERKAEEKEMKKILKAKAKRLPPSPSDMAGGGGGEAKNM
jgi:hypothetical protein